MKAITGLDNYFKFPNWCFRCLHYLRLSYILNNHISNAFLVIFKMYGTCALCFNLNLSLIYRE